MNTYPSMKHSDDVVFEDGKESENELREKAKMREMSTPTSLATSEDGSKPFKCDMCGKVYICTISDDCSIYTHTDISI
jgi:hypothetical protein